MSDHVTTGTASAQMMALLRSRPMHTTGIMKATGRGIGPVRSILGNLRRHGWVEESRCSACGEQVWRLTIHATRYIDAAYRRAVVVQDLLELAEELDVSPYRLIEDARRAA